MTDELQIKAPNRRRQNRVAAMQFIYMHSINKSETTPDMLRRFFENQENPREFYEFAEELVLGVIEHAAEVDKRIDECSSNWKFERIAKVDLAILRLAVYELLHREDIPPIVTIDEAIDISKEYSDDDARRFINGMLDKIKESLSRPLRQPKSRDEGDEA
jgi:N utilization substance protein B